MHENAPVLTAKKRERLGSRYSARLREQGGLPAIVYGHKEDPVPVAIDAHVALGFIHKGEKVFQLQLDGSNETVLLKDVQFDYLGTKIVHCDFARVSLTERVHVTVPVRLIGEARGLKTAGAVLMHPVGEIEIECIVTELPDFIEVDITDLDVEGSITAGEIRLPSDNMKLLTEADAMVAHVVGPAVEAPEGEQAVVEGSAQPEVIREKKKDEGDAKGGDKKK
jgi:large subunit ribosomal protein L25